MNEYLELVALLDSMDAEEIGTILRKSIELSASSVIDDEPTNRMYSECKDEIIRIRNLIVWSSCKK